MKICHLTSVHRTFDTRIFHRECRSLAGDGHEVILVASHDREETVDGVRIVPLKRHASRAVRTLLSPWTVYRIARSLGADAYHIHDPELLPIAMLLKLTTSARVVYDVHEDTPEYMLTKDWLPGPVRPVASVTVRALEGLAHRMLDAVIVAGGDIAENFPASDKVLLLRNLPVRDLVGDAPPQRDRGPDDSPVVMYTGLLSWDRGIAELVAAVKMVERPVRLVLVGSFDDDVFERKVRAAADERVTFVGQVPYREVFERLRAADIAALLFHPIPNNIAAIHGRNNKVYEYMAAGLPILAADLPGWREVIEDTGVGIVADPCDPVSIARGIDRLVADRELRIKLGEHGRELFLAEYNWDMEREQLLSLYRNWETAK
jgi:glycosyltransferase involved in cell wall biosynthesis